MNTCAEHGRLCAYAGDEPDRCPWCHCLWSHIIATVARNPEQGHSCEVSSVWHHDRAARVRQAVRMRREASIKVLRSANTPGMGKRS